MTDYSIKQYQPDIDSSFADSGLEQDLQDTFDNAYRDAYEQYTQTNEGEGDEIPEPEAGDVLTIMNLSGMLNLGELGWDAQSLANLQYPSNFQGVRLRQNMPVAEFVEWYFGTLCEDGFNELVQNESSPVQESLPPVRIGAKVLLSDWLDGNGDSVPLPEGVVVVAAAPPTRFISDESGVPKVMNYTPEANASPWYCFLLEQNLAEYEPMQLAEGQYRLDNLDGEFSSWVVLENGNRSRIVREVVNDRIDNRFTPAGFNIGSIGSIRPHEFLLGAYNFTNNRLNGRGNPSWSIPVLPENLVALKGTSSTPSEFTLQPKVIVEEDYVISSNNRTDSSVFNNIWVNVKSGEVKNSNSKPGRVWSKCPQIIYQGNVIGSTLADVKTLAEKLGYETSAEERNGNIIALTVDNEAFVAAIASTPAPLTARGTTKLKYR